jgi:hypothetical protein
MGNTHRNPCIKFRSNPYHIEMSKLEQESVEEEMMSVSNSEFPCMTEYLKSSHLAHPIKKYSYPDIGVTKKYGECV